MKKALHEAEKVLKKTPNMQTGRALKGIALMRLGRTDESSAIIDQIMTEKPIDTATLNVLSYIFKETDNCKAQSTCSVISSLINFFSLHFHHSRQNLLSVRTSR